MKLFVVISLYWKVCFLLHKVSSWKNLIWINNKFCVIKSFLIEFVFLLRFPVEIPSDEIWWSTIDVLLHKIDVLVCNYNQKTSNISFFFSMILSLFQMWNVSWFEQKIKIKSSNIDQYLTFTLISFSVLYIA
jgi:hypothetical protein